MAHAVGVILKRKLHVAVAKEGLHGFGICLDPYEEGRKAVAQIMKTESPGVIFYQFPTATNDEPLEE